MRQHVEITDEQPGTRKDLPECVRFFILALSVGLFFGCTDTVTLSRIQRLEQSVADLRGFQAEQTTQIAELQSTIRSTSGKVEELDYNQTQRLGGALSDLKRDLSVIRRKLPPPAIVPQAALESDENLSAQIATDIGSKLSEGLLRIREGKFAESLLVLQDGADLAVGSDQQAYFVFWKGLANEGLGDNKQAIASYNELATNFPKHSRNPLALLRQASIFIRIGDARIGKLTLQKLISDFPKSIEATQAKLKLKDMR